MIVICRAHDSMHERFGCCLWHAYEYISNSDELQIPYMGPSRPPCKRIGPNWNPRACSQHCGAVGGLIKSLNLPEPSMALKSVVSTCESGTTVPPRLPEILSDGPAVKNPFPPINCSCNPYDCSPHNFHVPGHAYLSLIQSTI